LGVQLNQDKNKNYHKGIQEIQSADSKVKILIIPTDEEIEIAQQAFSLIKNS